MGFARGPCGGHRLSSLPGQSRDSRGRHSGLRRILTTCSPSASCGANAINTNFNKDLPDIHVASQHNWVILMTARDERARAAMKHHLVRLDRVAGELNAWLLAIAIGLGMLDLTVLVAKCMPPLPRTPGVTSADGPGHAVVQPSSSHTSDVRS